MPEQRQDPTTGAWVVLSGDRGHRPIRLVTPELSPIDPSDCPFCRGNESVTLPTLAERTDASGWLVRAFPNRFPALRVEGDVSRALESKRREDAGPTMPPEGLCLEWIRYAEQA